jgi:hypothetical protein
MALRMLITVIMMTPSPMGSDMPLKENSVIMATCAFYLKAKQEFPKHEFTAFFALAQDHGQPGILNSNKSNQRSDNDRKYTDDIFRRRRGEENDDCDGVNRARTEIAEHRPRERIIPFRGGPRIGHDQDRASDYPEICALVSARE